LLLLDAYAFPAVSGIALRRIASNQSYSRRIAACDCTDIFLAISLFFSTITNPRSLENRPRVSVVNSPESDIPQMFVCVSLECGAVRCGAKTMRLLLYANVVLFIISFFSNRIGPMRNGMVDAVIVRVREAAVVAASVVAAPPISRE
jgi:hypothetical protein